MSPKRSSSISTSSWEVAPLATDDNRNLPGLEWGAKRPSPTWSFLRLTWAADLGFLMQPGVLLASLDHLLSPSHGCGKCVQLVAMLSTCSDPRQCGGGASHHPMCRSTLLLAIRREAAKSFSRLPKTRDAWNCCRNQRTT
jgi:hypothetical protein